MLIVERHIALLVDAGFATSEFWTGCSPPPRFQRATPSPARTHRPVPVVWLRPETPWIKLNTDGSFDRDTQIAGGGGLIRDHHGELLLAFHSSFQASSSFDAEIQALAVGLILVAQRSRYVLIELDAAAVVTLLTSGHRGSWQVRHTLMRIRHILRDIQFRVTHIYREGNMPADCLSELGMSSLGIQTYSFRRTSWAVLFDPILTKSLMDIGCQILLILEEGYNKATTHGLVACVHTLLENRVISPMETAIETFTKVRELLAPHWPCLVRKAGTTEQKLSIIQRQAAELQEHVTYEISTIETQAVKLQELQEQASDQASTIERQIVKLQEVQEQSVDQASPIEWQAVKLQEQAATLQSIKDLLK
ncbi:hypothetical protein OROHE_008715 [Orobanche hederae]